jgi:quaternary ammonium compound-resistance protein SugE
MAWLLLFAAGIAEIVMAMSLKAAEGWTRLGPSMLGLSAALASVVLLTFAVTRLPVTTAYAVWTGFGAIGVSLIGIVLYGESAHPLRLACLAAVFAGMIGLHLIETKV